MPGRLLTISHHKCYKNDESVKTKTTDVDNIYVLYSLAFNYFQVSSYLLLVTESNVLVNLKCDQ